MPPHGTGSGPPPDRSDEAGRRKGALHGVAVAALREMIVTGVLAPGARLNERELCARLATSRTPVREAIKTLVQDGLLVARPNRSPIVTTLDPAQVESLAEVLAAVEALAGEAAAPRATDEDIGETGLLHYRMVLHHARGELGAYFAANKMFHSRIVSIAGNPVLREVWEMLSLRADRARYSSNHDPARWRTAIEEHAAIQAALARRDGAALGALLRSHVSGGLSSLVAALRAGSAS